MQNPWHAVLDLQVGQEQCCWQVPCITVRTIAGIVTLRNCITHYYVIEVDQVYARSAELVHTA